MRRRSSSPAPNAFTVAPVSGATQFTAARSGNGIVAVAVDFVFWREETATGEGFADFQQARSVTDMRRAARKIATTHNFNAVDNQAWNGVGTDEHGPGQPRLLVGGLLARAPGRTRPEASDRRQRAQPARRLRGHAELRHGQHAHRRERALRGRPLPRAGQLRLRQPRQPRLGVHREDRRREPARGRRGASRATARTRSRSRRTGASCRRPATSTR